MGTTSAHLPVARDRSTNRMTALPPPVRMPSDRGASTVGRIAAGAPVAARWPSLVRDVLPVGGAGRRGAGDRRARTRAGCSRAPLSSCLPLLVRRRWPTAVFLLVGFLSAISAARASPAPSVQVGAVALASYTTGDYRRGDRVRGGLVVGWWWASSIAFALVAPGRRRRRGDRVPVSRRRPDLAPRRHRSSATARGRGAARGLRASGRAGGRKSESARRSPRSARRWRGSCTTWSRTASA